MDLFREKTLTDLVRGIRACKRDVGLYISQCISEIKEEIKSTDTHIKSNALQKMTFLQMMGYNMSPWASFSCVEVMSAPKFAQKRIGYLAACQSFNEDTGDVIILCTNLLQKELKSAANVGSSSAPPSIVYDAGLAINCLSNIVTRDLAQDLLPEVQELLRHPRPYLRKKAVLCLFKMFVKYPEGLRVSFPYIKHVLKDPDPSVVSCAVNVIAELSDKNGPKNYLLLAPQFFELLKTSNNNWMLIKVVKLLGGLVSEEPRLARKLLEPLASIAKNTQAKSLLYEAVFTITIALLYARKSDGSMPASVPSIVSFCSRILKEFVEERDQNLRYLGLVGFGSLMLSHPQAVIEHRGLILKCLSEEDVTLRTRALELLTGMVTKKNLKDLINQLICHVDNAESSYREDLVGKIILMCSKDKYTNVSDFSWYIAVLVKMSKVQGTSHGPLVASQMLDVSLRVLPVRPFSVRNMMNVILNHFNKQKEYFADTTMLETLCAAAWIVGEYALLIDEVVLKGGDDNLSLEWSVGPYHAIIAALLSTSSFNLESKTQYVYVQAALKVFAACCNSNQVTDSEIDACVHVLQTHLPLWINSYDFEVMERAFSFHQLLISFGILSKKVDLSGLSFNEEKKSCEEESSDEKALGPPDGDLLGLSLSKSEVAISEKQIESLSYVSSSRINSSSVANICRKYAARLKSLLIPEAMKPVGSKAQQRIEVPSNFELDAPLKLSLFEKLFEDEKSRQNASISIEEISFDQQRPMRRQSEKNSFANIDTFESSQEMTFDSTNLIEEVNKDTPFYLSSGVNQEDMLNDLVSRPKESTQFGIIELNDFDDSDNDNGKKKRKKKKKNRKNKKVGLSLNLGSFEDGPVTIYHSDDDDGIENNFSQPFGTTVKPMNDEFLGLAQVDLSEPVGVEDILPNRQHRKVVEHSKVSQQQQQKDSRVQKKKSKEKKKKKDKNSTNATSVTTDLLDFNFGDNVTVSTHDPISNAFDSLVTTTLSNSDMLGLSTTLTSDKEALQKTILSSKSSKRPWIRSSVKSSVASSIDWEMVQVFFRAFDAPKKSNGNSNVFYLVVKIINSSSKQLENVTISFDEESYGPIIVGTVQSNGIYESSSKEKFGPFRYVGTSTSPFTSSIKMKLMVSSDLALCKLLPPVGLLLMPVTGVTHDEIMNELSSRNWHSASAKVSMSGMSLSQVAKSLSQFLKAEIVGEDSTSAILAMQYKRLEQIRLLLKAKKSSQNIFKIDIKSTNEILSKTIASDLKRVCF